MIQSRPPQPSPAELQIFVRRNSRETLTFEVHSESLGLQNKDFGSISVEGDLRAQVQDDLGKALVHLSDLAAKGMEGVASQRLADLAVALYQKMPKDLRELLWSRREHISAVQILTDEPYIPWELLKLQGELGEEGPFLCEAFPVTRWLRNFHQSIEELPLQNVAFVGSTDSGLPNSAAEKEGLIALLGAERLSEIPATFESVARALATGNYDAWHFCGHGSARSQDMDRAEIYLNSEESLTPTNLVGAKANLGRLQPLIFLNGCNTGRGGFSLAGLSGWVQQSLEAGAGAFIGTLWSVRDQKARAFAEAFYRHFIGGSPIGNAVQRARLEVRALFPGDPAWLAYTVYARPGAICSMDSKNSSNVGRIVFPAKNAGVANALESLGPESAREPAQAKPVTPAARILEPRTSNLRIKRPFTDRQRDKFVEDSFDYIANFFENSLSELQLRYQEVETSFRRVDASRFTAAIYINGEKQNSCRIFRGDPMMGDIAYASGESGPSNTWNEALSIVDNGLTLMFRALGLRSFGNDRESLSEQGAAECLWSILVERLQ